MKRVVLVVFMLLVVASPAFAQAPARSGFTALANVGAGFQHDTFYDETPVGLAVSFGAGVFVTDRIAVLGRYAGTSAHFDGPDLSQMSGVWGGSIQCWLNKWASIEVGAGYGRWSDEFNDSDGGFGLILGFHATVWQSGPHHVRAGVEYTPVFTDSKVHNIGVVAGYQYVR